MTVGIAGLRVINFTLSQNEGEAAILSVEAPTPGVNGLAGMAGYYDLEGAGVGFRGYLHAAPGNVSGARITAEFIAQPEDLDEALKAYANTLRDLPYYDPLFFGGERNWGGVDDDGVEIEDDRDPAEVLEARSAVFHIDPETHEISLSDYLEGEAGNIDVGTRFDAASLSTAIVDSPVIEATADLVCEWTQSASGTVNIASRLNFGLSGSLTDPSSVTDRGSIGADSGWSVERAVFRSWWEPTLSRFYTGRYDDVTQSKINPVTGEPEDETVRQWEIAPLKRYWLDVDRMDASYSYSQARREVVSFTMRCDAQPVLGERRKEKMGRFTLSSVTEDMATPKWRPDTYYEKGSLVQYAGRTYEAQHDIPPAERFDPFGEVFFTTWGSPYRVVRPGTWYNGRPNIWEVVRVGGMMPQWKRVPSQAALPDPRSPTFFGTPRGRMAAMHLALRLRAFLRKRMRAYNVTFRGTWEDLAGVTLKHTVTLSHPSLPGGTATGKVIAYRKVWKGEDPQRTRYVEVTIGCAAGNGSAAPEDVAWPSYSEAFEDGYAEDDSAERVEKVDDLTVTLTGPSPYVPVDPYLLGNPSYAVVNVKWENLYEDQIREAHRADAALKRALFRFEEDLPPNAADAVSQMPTSYSVQMRSLRSGGVLVRNMKAVTSVARVPKHITL